MSWFIQYFGERAAVRRAVENDKSIPNNIKTVILDTIHEKVPKFYTHQNGIRVRGTGHENKNDDSCIGSINELIVEPITIVT